MLPTDYKKFTVYTYNTIGHSRQIQYYLHLGITIISEKK